MTSERNGTALKKKFKLRPGWQKLGLAILASNMIFFLLFGGPSESQDEPLPERHVELGVQGRLHTPFRAGKRVLVVNKKRTKKVAATLAGEETAERRYLLLVKDEDSIELLREESWEILPYMPGFRVYKSATEMNHEIRY